MLQIPHNNLFNREPANIHFKQIFLSSSSVLFTFRPVRSTSVLYVYNTFVTRRTRISEHGEKFGAGRTDQRENLCWFVFLQQILPRFFN